MVKIVLSIFLTLFFTSSFSQVYVNGYYRKNGTYVEPHYRSSPNSSPYDNFSFPGNINPYSGKISIGNPDTYLENYYNKKNSSSSYNSNSYINLYPNFSSPKTNTRNSTNSNEDIRVNIEKWKVEENRKIDEKINQFKLIYNNRNGY